jgi:hypothetical protein
MDNKEKYHWVGQFTHAFNDCKKEMQRKPGRSNECKRNAFSWLSNQPTKEKLWKNIFHPHLPPWPLGAILEYY